MDREIRVLFLPSRRVQEREIERLQTVIRRNIPFSPWADIHLYREHYSNGIIGFRRYGEFYAIQVDGVRGRPPFSFQFDGEKVNRFPSPNGFYVGEDVYLLPLQRFINELTDNEPWVDWGLQVIDGVTQPGVAWIPQRVEIQRPTQGSYLSPSGVIDKPFSYTRDLLYHLYDVDLYASLPLEERVNQHSVPLPITPLPSNEDWERLLLKRKIEPASIDEFHNLHLAGQEGRYLTLPSLDRVVDIPITTPPYKVVWAANEVGTLSSLNIRPLVEPCIPPLKLTPTGITQGNIEAYSTLYGVEMSLPSHGYLSQFQVAGSGPIFYLFRCRGEVLHKGIGGGIVSLPYPIYMPEGTSLFIASYEPIPTGTIGPPLTVWEGSPLVVPTLSLPLSLGWAEKEQDFKEYSFTVTHEFDAQAIESYVPLSSSLSIPREGKGDLKIRAIGLPSFWGSYISREILNEGTIIYANQWGRWNGVEVRVKHYLPNPSSIAVQVSTDEGYTWTPLTLLESPPYESVWKGDMITSSLRVRIDMEGSAQAKPLIEGVEVFSINKLHSQ